MMAIDGIVIPLCRWSMTDLFVDRWYILAMLTACERNEQREAGYEDDELASRIWYS
jgi:hypothetical protein